MNTAKIKAEGELKIRQTNNTLLTSTGSRNYSEF